MDEGGSGVASRDDGDNEWRCWEGMSPELLALIFSQMPADELHRAVPLVCKSWCEALVGPYCWSEIDIEAWCRRVNRTDVIDFAVRMLVRRSGGTLRRLSAYRIGDSGFSVAASFGELLNSLQIPMGQISNTVVDRCVASFSKLTVLNISYCLGINSRSIEAFGNNCKCLIHLTRNLPPIPLEIEFNHDNHILFQVDEEEAMAVANTMPKLEHLQLGNGRFSDHGLDAVLTNCKALRILDITGCWNVMMEGDVGLRCDSIENFTDPWYHYYEFEYPSSADEDSGIEDSDDI